MSDKKPSDWDSRAEHVLENQGAAYDEMRHKCPVAHDDFLNWSLFRHEDVMRVLHDHDTFSSSVSSHVSVPNSMDPPDHTEYRSIIEPFFAPAAMESFAPVCRSLAHKLVTEIPRHKPTEFIQDFAMHYALQVQCAFLGWPMAMQEPLRLWMQKNHAATLAQDRAAMSEVAAEFAGLVRTIITDRQAAGEAQGQDVVAQLMRARVKGRALNEEEIVSILRNWTGGEVATISASVGIIVHYLADHPHLQTELRARPDKLPYAIDEILRIHGPLATNRRKTKCPVEIGGRQIDAGERITIVWPSANRDEDVFENPEEFRWDRDQSRNLLYGAGIHWCPGAPLARMELQVVMEELLANTQTLALLPDAPTPRAVYPASGYAEAHLTIT